MDSASLGILCLYCFIIVWMTKGITILLFHSASYILNKFNLYPCQCTNIIFAYSVVLILHHVLIDTPPPNDANVSVVALNEAGKVKVTWRQPLLRACQKIMGYSVQYREQGNESYAADSVSNSSKTTHTITNLKLGTVYEVGIASMGPLGLSEYCCGSGKVVVTHDSECNLVVIQ